jgi:hypothetical protein
LARPLLIVIHGMGAHGTAWEAPLLTRFGEIAATFGGIAAGGPLDQQVVFAPIRYDDIFDGWLDRWEQMGSKLDEFLKASDTKLPRLTGFMRDTLVPSAERGFFWSHAFDAISYRAVPLIRDQVRARVAADIVSAINAHLNAEPGAEVSVLAHSLGTIVTHDVLTELATSKQTKPFNAGKFRFANLFLLANAVRLGPSALVKPEPEKTPVRPVSAGPAGQHAPYCGFYHTFRNHWDPVPNWQPFVPTKWGAGFNDVKVRHIHQVNVHGYEHYLEHPDVHVRILRSLLGTHVIPGPEWQQRVADFPAIKPNACGTAVSELMNRLDELRTVTTSGKLDDVAMAMVALYRAIEHAKTTCQEMFNADDGWL